jgi:predicted phage terminase large subunit-like protein
VTTPPSIDLGRVQGERAALIRSLCRDSFLDFVTHGWPALEPNGRPFVRNVGTDAIIEHLQAVGDGKIRRLLMAVSPGFGKSTLATVAWHLWMWTRNPSWRTICASYAYTLAAQLALRARRVMDTDFYRGFGVELFADRIDAMETRQGGRRYAVGVEGATTGFRADAAVIDDSLNAVNAHSDNAIRTVNDWFDVAIGTRLDRGDTAPIIVVQQCLAEKDLIGHLREQGGWEQLVLPAEFESSRRCVTCIWQDPRTIDGEMLAPELQSRAYLDEKRRTLGPYGYAAQYQQRPAPLAGGMIKAEWFKRFTIGEVSDNGKLALDWLTISVDPTGDAVHDGDNVGLIVIGGKGPRRYVFEDKSRRMTGLETIATIKELLVAYPTCKRVVVEKSVVGPLIVEMLRKEVNQGSLRTVVVEALTTHMLGKKEQRVMAMVPALAAGLVYLLDGAPWTAEFVAEHSMFPNGAHDDRCDALAQALAHHAEKSGVERFRMLATL